MRIIGIVAVFVLAIAAVVEGAALVRLSGRLDSLAQGGSLAADPSSEDMSRRLPPVRAIDDQAAAAGRPPVPRLAPAIAVPAAAPTAAAPPGSPPAVLREALATPEGRQHLKAALETLREQERQERLVRNAERDVEREQRQRERMARLLGLGIDEQNRIGHLYTTLQSARQRVLEDMRVGGKSAEQADDEIDALEDEAQRNVRTLLGEDRVRKLREAERGERRRERGGREGGGPPAPPGQPAPAAQGAGSPPA
jgi:hypothetical protein